MHKFMRLPVALLCAIVMLFTAVAQAVTPQDYDVTKPENLEAGHLHGEYCIVLDADSGDILFQKDAYTRCYPASTTKIMTCILALESELVGTMVTIPDGIAVSSDSSKLGIKVGEVMNFTDLLYGMMLDSGNDAALAVAILISGTDKQFARLMNEKAQELGMTGTHYENPHGYHNVNHYTTAYDLTLLTRYALKNDLFRQIVSTLTYTLPPTNVRDTGLVVTSNYILLDPTSDYYYAPCIGVKSGNTNAAGRCFVGAATQNGATLVSVTLKAGTADDTNKYKNAFVDTIRLMKYGFLQYKPLSFNDMYALCKSYLPGVQVGNVTEDDQFGGVLELEAVNVSSADYREWYLERSLSDKSFLDALAESFMSRYSITLNPDPLIAPIKQGNVVGTLSFEGQNGELLEGTLVASRDVGEDPLTLNEVVDTWVNNNAPWMKYLMPRHTPVMRYIYWAALALIVLVTVIRVRRVRAFNRRRRALIEKKRRAYLAQQNQRPTAPRAVAASGRGQAQKPSTYIPARKPAAQAPARKSDARR